MEEKYQQALKQVQALLTEISSVLIFWSKRRLTGRLSINVGFRNGEITETSLETKAPLAIAPVITEDMPHENRPVQGDEQCPG